MNNLYRIILRPLRLASRSNSILFNCSQSWDSQAREHQSQDIPVSGRHLNTLPFSQP